MLLLALTLPIRGHVRVAMPTTVPTTKKALGGVDLTTRTCHSNYIIEGPTGPTTDRLRLPNTNDPRGRPWSSGIHDAGSFDLRLAPLSPRLANDSTGHRTELLSALRLDLSCFLQATTRRGRPQLIAYLSHPRLKSSPDP